MGVICVPFTLLPASPALHPGRPTAHEKKKAGSSALRAGTQLPHATHMVALGASV